MIRQESVDTRISPARRPPRAPRRTRAYLRARAIAAALLATLALGQPAAALEEVPYVKTPEGVVDAILALASVGPGDFLIDLGSGDGRIVIAAARRFGTRGLGIEIDPSLVELSNTRAAAAGVADLARFRSEDLFETDLSGASVVTIYLLPDVNVALRPRLLAMLAPGTRVVSHDWDMGDWRPDRSVVVAAPDKPVGLEKRSVLHLWIIPARIEGDWASRIEGVAGAQRLAIRQRFQDIEVSTGAAGGASTGRIDGSRVRIEMVIDGAPALLEGSVSAGTIEGSATIAGRRSRWQANRAPAR